MIEHEDIRRMKVVRDALRNVAWLFHQWNLKLHHHWQVTCEEQQACDALWLSVGDVDEVIDEMERAIECE